MRQKSMRKTTYYNARHVPPPVQEHWPKDCEELNTLILDAPGGVGRVIFGGGQHIRPQHFAMRPFEAIRTDHCHRILHLDRESALVTVEAGIRWGDLREKLREDGFSLCNYRPYPDAASLGGLLAKHSPGAPYWLSGDLREGCVSLSAVSPKIGAYRYLEAPRKACGPDLRHLFMGGEGQLGAILDVTISVQKPFPARLIIWEAPSASSAVACMRALSNSGLRATWCHWKRSAGKFHAVIHAPTRLLDAMVARVQAGLLALDSAPNLPAPTIQGDEEARDFRQELEWDIDRKSTRLNSSHVRISYAVFCLKKITKSFKLKASRAAQGYVEFSHFPPSVHFDLIRKQAAVIPSFSR